MFGTNPTRKVLRDDGKVLATQEIFLTIQGEGPFAGVPALFIRLAGCHLACHFCDTDFESHMESRATVSVAAEAQELARGTHLYVLTGGEPLRQNIAPLCLALLENPLNVVQIETAGNIWQKDLTPLFKDPALAPRLHLVCSPKTVSAHAQVQKYCRHWKYIIDADLGVNESNGIPNFNTQQKGVVQYKDLFHPTRADTIWLQPCEAYSTSRVTEILELQRQKVKISNSGSDQAITTEARDFVRTARNMKLAVELAIKFNYRVSLQLHKILGLP